MEPGVAFPLLAGVELLAVAALLALAGVACFGRLRCAGTPLVVAGALALAVPEAWIATNLGDAQLSWPSYVRAGGALLVAAGLLAGALTRLVPVRRRDPSLVAGTLGVVAPLGAPLGPGALALAATVLAGVAALRGPRPAHARLFAAAFLTIAGADAAAIRAAGSEPAALVELALRGLGALLILGGVALLCRFSVLAKVVAAILAGVLAMAVAAVSVVGTVLTSSYADQQRTQVSGVASGRLDNIGDLTLSAQQLAGVVTLCPGQSDACQRLLAIVSGQEQTFAAIISRAGDVVGQYGDVLDQAAAVQLVSQPAIEQVLAGGVHAPSRVGTLVSLAGRTPLIAAIGIAAVPSPGAVGAPPQAAAVFGYLLGADYAQASRRTVGSGYDVSLLVNGQVAASSLSARGAQEVLAVAHDTDVSARTLGGGTGLTVTAEGARPTVQFRPLLAANGDRVGLLAVSRSAQDVLDTERAALADVFLTALAVTVLVGLLSLLLGRRVAEPVRRLTAAASRVRRGDLATSVSVRSEDEVGTLSRAFDAMTVSLATMTGDLRTAADEQSALRARLETVLDSMSDGLLTTDGSGTVTSVNPAALALLGETDAGSVVGRPLAAAVDLRGTGDVPVDVVALRGEVVGELSGDVDPVPVRVAAGRLEDGSGLVVLIRDMRREREVERMKTEFLSNVSHELRTPLTPIRGYAEMLRRRPDLPDDTAADYAKTIFDSSVRMSRVVDLLVDVAALEAGRVVAYPQPVVVPAFVDDRLADWRERVPARADDLRRRAASGLPPMLIDPSWVGKAYDELVDNALKYSPPGTPVTLTAGRCADGARIRIGVRDAGPGIAAEELPGLFAAFEQADGSATRAVGGLGLGLSFVRRLCEDFGLRVSVESTPGKGSEFSLEVPIAPDVGVPPARRTPGRAARAPGRAAGRRASGAASRSSVRRGEPVRRRRPE